jgi:hypothetical protein
MTVESWRKYTFPSGLVLVYWGVVKILTSDDGTDCLKLKDGLEVIVRPGWCALEIHKC